MVNTIVGLVMAAALTVPVETVAVPAETRTCFWFGNETVQVVERVSWPLGESVVVDSYEITYEEWQQSR